jgi:hypothetical protein
LVNVSTVCIGEYVSLEGDRGRDTSGRSGSVAHMRIEDAYGRSYRRHVQPMSPDSLVTYVPGRLPSSANAALSREDHGKPLRLAESKNRANSVEQARLRRDDLADGGCEVGAIPAGRRRVRNECAHLDLQASARVRHGYCRR